MPCGVRYSDKVLSEISDDFLFENDANHQLVRSRALDEQSSGNQTVRANMLIERQTQSLGRMLGRLSEVSGSFAAAERNQFRKLVHESQTLLPANLRSTAQEAAAQRSIIRSAKTKWEIEAEARDLFNKSRNLMQMIQKNLQIKKRVSLRLLFSFLHFHYFPLPKPVQLIVQFIVRESQIIGGSQASIKEFPWLCSIQLKGGSHICGGSIVTPEFIVTASHCVTE